MQIIGLTNFISNTCFNNLIPDNYIYLIIKIEETA